MQISITLTGPFDEDEDAFEFARRELRKLLGFPDAWEAEVPTETVPKGVGLVSKDLALEILSGVGEKTLTLVKEMVKTDGRLIVAEFYKAIAGPMGLHWKKDSKTVGGQVRVATAGLTRRYRALGGSETRKKTPYWWSPETPDHKWGMYRMPSATVESFREALETHGL
jgi:hypothetical protein